MSDASQPGDLASAAGDCPLPHAQQTRNLLIYGLNVGLMYLSAPVSYLAIQPALCEQLKASKTISNFPSAVYFWMTPLPIVVAWLFPKVRQLKPVLVTCYLITAGLGALVAASLLVPTPGWAESAMASLNAWLPENGQLPLDWVMPAIFLHAAVTGCTAGVVATYQWEVVGGGVSESRRGQALALAFGLMPLLAVAGSAGSQLVLDGKVAGLAMRKLGFPGDFALLFGAIVPMMALAAVLSLGFVIPRPTVEVARQPFFRGIFGGFGQFLGHHQILIAALAMILVGTGYNILPNITLYTQDVLGAASKAYVGYQSMLRFGFKMAAGLTLGWLLTKTNPKVPMLATAGFALASVYWALRAQGLWFLLSFGLMGGGELFGVYYPNYILTCSAKSKMRRNMAFVSMLNMPCGFASVVYGSIADRYDIPASFVAAYAVLGLTLVVVQLGLSKTPRPRDRDLDESDRAQLATQQA